jgi:hypothetical protein
VTAEDRELERWKREWQAEVAGPLPRLRQRVRLQTVRMIASNLFGVTVGVALLIYAARLVLRQPTPRTMVWSAAVLVCWIATGIFVVWNQIGIWRVEVDSTRAYAELEYKRALTKIRKTRFMLVAFYCGAAFDVAFFIWTDWLTISSDRTVFFADLARLSLGLPAIWLFIKWYGRRKVRQAERARRFMKELQC